MKKPSVERLASRGGPHRRDVVGMREPFLVAADELDRIPQEQSRGGGGDVAVDALVRGDRDHVRGRSRQRVDVVDDIEVVDADVLVSLSHEIPRGLRTRSADSWGRHGAAGLLGPQILRSSNILIVAPGYTTREGHGSLFCLVEVPRSSVAHPRMLRIETPNGGRRATLEPALAVSNRISVSRGAEQAVTILRCRDLRAPFRLPSGALWIGGSRSSKTPTGTGRAFGRSSRRGSVRLVRQRSRMSSGSHAGR